MSEKTKTLPRIEAGKRAVLAGRTGSGKTTVANWLIKRSDYHWLIINPKWTAGYKNLPDSNIIRGINIKKIEKSLAEYQYTIINPDGAENTPETLDALIDYFHSSYEGIGFLIDELYSLHKNGRAGAGMVGLLTRGRELKQSFLGLTQRPSWLSAFVFSESDYIGAMSLTMKKDRQKMYENTGNEYFLSIDLEPREWLWYDVAGDELVLYGAVPYNT